MRRRRRAAAQHHLPGAARRARRRPGDRARPRRDSRSAPAPRAAPARSPRATCWRRWAWARWPARRSASRCRGTRRGRRRGASPPPIGAWRPGCARRWRRARPEPTLAAMTARHPPEPPGLSRQPGDHAAATRACWRRCCPGSPSNTAIRTASSTRWAPRPRRRWRTARGAGRRADRRRCQGDRVHLGRDREQQHRHQGRRPLRRRSWATSGAAIVTVGDRAQMRAGIGGRPGGGGVRAGVPAGAPGRAAGPRRAARGAGGADAAGQRHGGEQRDRRDPGHRRRWPPSPSRPARCSTPMPRRRPARSRST